MERKKSEQVNAMPLPNVFPKTFVFSEPNVLIPPKIMSSGVNFERVSDTFGKRNLFTFATPTTVSQAGVQESSICQSGIEKHYKPKISRNSYKPVVNVFAQALKDTAMFKQLKKNSKSQVVEFNPENSITCMNVPKSLLTKMAAKKYFSMFGNLLKIAIKPAKQIIVVIYASKEEANEAYQKCGECLEQKFDVEWTKLCSSPKSPIKKKDLQNIVSNFLKSSDDEIKSELDAMMNLEYNLHSNSNDNFDGTLPKRSTALQAKLSAKAAARTEKASAKPEKLKPDSQIADLLPNVTTEELQNIIQQPASTSEDKYKVLEARDRLMRMKQVKSHTLAAAKLMTGTCPDMCPEKERLMRESNRQVALYEQLDSNEYRINHAIAVKQYSRSSADQEEPMAHELRPVKSLKMTMSYLLHEIADLCDLQGTNLGEWYHFLWDRTRGIRKDITQQELCCADSVELVEQCARFHIVCSERLCAEEPSIFDKRINSDNLTKCLQSLKYMYHDLRVKGITCKNESEFRAYIILLNLNNGNFMWDLQRLPESIQKSPEVRFALEVYSALESNNYYKFFKLVRHTTYLNACILLRYFNQVRLKALSVMVKAYCRTASTAYPLYELIDILGFEDENEAINFCEQVGLNTKDELHVLLNRQNFTMPVLNIKQNRACCLIESKRTVQRLSIGVCIAGGEMPEKTYKYHKPHSSFDAHGYLLPDSVNAEDQSRNIIPEERDPYEFIDEDAMKTKTPSEPEKDRNKIETTITAEHTNIFQSVVNSEPDVNIFTTIKPVANVFAPKPQVQIKESQTGVMSKPKAETQKDSKTFSFTSKPQDIASTATKPSEPFGFSSTFSITTTTPKTSSVFSRQFEAAQSNDVASPFSTVTSKSIFSGPPQGNIFMRNSAPSTIFSTVPSGVQTIAKSSNAATTITDNKFKETQSFVVRAEEVQKPAPMEAKTEKSKLEEQEHAKKMQQIHEAAEEIFNALQTEIVQTCCSNVVKEEINQINISKTVKEILGHILDEVTHEMCASLLREEIDNTRKLQEMLMKIKNRIVVKYFNIWKSNLKRRQQRKALDDTPVWLQKRSSRQSAKLMYSKEQDLVIQNMCKRQDVQKTATRYIDSLAPIEVIIYIGIKENLKSLNTNTRSNYYWKLVISWPNLHNKPILWHHKKIMNQYLCPNDYTMEPILKIYQPNEIETLHICMRHFEGVINEYNLTGSDALLFIAAASEDMKFVVKRLTKNVLSREKLTPIPLVFIVLGDANFEAPDKKFVPSIEKLLKSGYLSAYTIMHEKNLTETNILNLTQSAVLWLSLNKAGQNPLETDYLYNICDSCLTEELWLRVLDDSSLRDKLVHALEEPKFIIDLHNEAVDHLIEIILDPESFMYTKFAPEFKKFVKNQYMMPCGYEHFDEACIKEDYKVKVETVMSNFRLPRWGFSWPIHDTITLRQCIIKYCQQALSSYNSDEISTDILTNLFFPSGLSTVTNFIDILLYIIKKKMYRIDEDLKVIYNKYHVKHFRTLPWWLKSNLLIEYEIPFQHYNVNENEKENKARNESSEPVVKKRKLHKSRENDSEFEPLAEFCENSQSQVMEVHNTSKKIEERLKERQQDTLLFEERLKNALLSEIEST